MKSRGMKMTKTDPFSQQMQTANLNLGLMHTELERTRTLIDIAVATDSIGNDLAASVRDAALTALLTTLRPPMQVEQTPETALHLVEDQGAD